MTKFRLPNTNNKNENEINKFSDFNTLCSFIISHPLYLSYLIFFFPYFLKLFSFLTPLILTTFLLVLSLITTLVPLKSIINSEDGIFLTAFNAVIEKLRPNSGDDEGEKEQAIEEFEVYKIVFDVPTIEMIEENSVENDRFGENPDEILVEKVCVCEEGTVNERGCLTMEQETGDTNHEKLEEVEVKEHEETLISCGSEVNEVKNTPKFGSLSLDTTTTTFKPYSETHLGSIKFYSETHLGSTNNKVLSPLTNSEQHIHNLGNYGSKRKEKEWRRTLACKLFEERHNWSNNKINVDNGDDSEECMDLLWETPEAEIFTKVKSKEKVMNNKKGRKKDKVEESMKDEYEKEEDYEEEDYEDSGKICCLQAFKLSAGKMNLTAGRPNLAKFSKAFKGIGWLQSQVRRQGKKVYK